jgi:hypothetical protein
MQVVRLFFICLPLFSDDAENIKFAYLASQLREKFIRNRTAVQSSFLEIDADYGQSQMEIFERQRRFFNYTDAGLTLYHVQMVNYTNGSVSQSRKNRQKKVFRSVVGSQFHRTTL